jgi:ABC-type transport system involved in cytochrome bd biosynthesis fused ATPase/permease subunit
MTTGPAVLLQDRDPAIDIRDLASRRDAAAPVGPAPGQLCIEQGEHLFVATPSGSGKSTLPSLLAGVATPRGGSVRVLDSNLPGAMLGPVNTHPDRVVAAPKWANQGARSEVWSFQMNDE